MGSGKRNYSAMRQQYRKSPKKEKRALEVKSDPPKEEDVKELLNLWQKNKSEKKDGE